MSKFLRKAFDMRQTADYEEEAELTREDAQISLELAEKFISSAEERLSQGE